MRTQKESTVVAVDLERCLSCRSCELACAKAHAGFRDIVEAILSGAHLVPRVRVVAAAGRGVPVQCQHCEDAPCVAVCPSGALYLDEATGHVLAREGRCIGCKACVIVCPFGAAEWDRVSGSVGKCDFCAGIIAAGEEPRCIAACPTRARRVIRVEDLSKRRQKEAAARTLALHEATAREPEK